MAIFQELREALLQCKQSSNTFSELNECKIEAAQIAEEAIEAVGKLKGIFDCNKEGRQGTNYVIGLSELAAIGSFDDEDIESMYPLVCEGGSIGETTIDLIALKNGKRHSVDGIPSIFGTVDTSELKASQGYVIKHGGSQSDPIKDAQVWGDVQLIAAVLGEDMPPLVWADPLNSRFAMGWFPHKPGGEHYTEYKPHEIVTSAIFETVTGDYDRHEDNVVELRNWVLGHVDFSGSYTGQILEVGSQPVCELLFDINESSGLDELEGSYPGIKTAIEEAKILWDGTWRRKLQKLETTRWGATTLHLVSERRLQAVDELLNGMLNGEVSVIGSRCYDYREGKEREERAEYAAGKLEELCYEIGQKLDAIHVAINEESGPLGDPDPECPSRFDSETDEIEDLIGQWESYADQAQWGINGAQLCAYVTEWQEEVYPMAQCIQQVVCDKKSNQKAAEGLAQHIVALNQIKGQINQAPLFGNQMEHIHSLRSRSINAYNKLLNDITQPYGYDYDSCGAPGDRAFRDPFILDYEKLAKNFKVNFDLHTQLKDQLSQAERIMGARHQAAQRAFEDSPKAEFLEIEAAGNIPAFRRSS